MEYDEFRAMNTDILLAAEGEPERLARGFKETRAWVGAMEERLTRFTDTSELAQLNRSHGSWFHASPELFEILQLARGFYDETDHLFDPAVLDVLEQIGYDKSFEKIEQDRPNLPAPTSPPSTSPPSPLLKERGVASHHAFSEVQFDPAKHAILLPPGLRLDLGGIAKGWIAERAADKLAAFAEACAVNAGGDMFMVGRPADGGVWRIALEDPRDPEQTLAVLRVGAGAVATSSITRRRWQQGDAVRHHLIDPRRGAPAETDWLSVTVVAPRAAAAEVFAKVLLIMGSGGTREMAARQSGIDFIAVDREGRLWGSDRAKELLEHGIE
jgi:thiamine biosynthesis lipoprotein